MGKSAKNMTRKERRKKERQMKKAKKCSIYMEKHMKKNKTTEAVKSDCKKLVEEKNKSEDVNKLLKMKKQQQKKEKNRETAVAIRRRQLTEENKREDRNIRKLEKMMKLNRRKKKTLPKSFVDDGLSYILEACDSETVKNLDPAKEFIEKDEFESDVDEFEESESDDETKMPKNVKPKDGKKTVTWKDEVGNDDDEMEMDDEDDFDDNDESVEMDSMDLNDDVFEDNVKDSDFSDDENKVREVGEATKTDGEFWEDIYGRKRDKEGKVVTSQAENQGKYIPPSKRCDEDSEKLVKLKKHLKGLLNRLSEGNIKAIATQIEDLYLNNSRNDMNQTLESLMFSSIVQCSLTPERLVQEHAMLIALLHADIGSEVGSHFLQALAVKFNELHSRQVEEENKEIHNVLMLLANLYNFKVVHSLLMINLLHVLAERFNALDLELILLMLRNIGFVLRKDDPTSLKEVVLKLQSKAHESAQGENESRVRFMLETVMAIKNNNMSKIPNYDPSHMDHLRKLLRGFVRKGCFVVELRISLDDLLNAETKGRWWIVGSSWSGEQLNDDKKSDRVSAAPVQYNEKILELARKQRMNTDVRRNIFCIIMTADDCVDCFEKLMKLGLQTQQEREIVHVIINCCMNEAKFNRYYALLATKFCNCNRKFQMAFQCALWDRFKELDNMKKVQSTNMAEFLAYLITASNLSLSILKVIHFSEMNKNLVRFLRQLLVRVLFDNDFKTIFQKINPSPKLRMFREGLRLFLLHFILRQKDKIENSDELEERINEAEKILVATDSLVRF